MTELLVVLFVTLLVFGATRIPALGDALGRALRNARAGTADDRGAGDAAGRDPAGRDR
jgi:sec-independent protein translocase protein TatA